MAACLGPVCVLPLGWYALLLLVAALGIVFWWLRMFTDKVTLGRFIAVLGSVCMLSLVLWTWQLDL